MEHKYSEGDLCEGTRRDRYGKGPDLQGQVLGEGVYAITDRPQVNNSPRTKPRFAISSLAKDVAKGTRGVIATDRGSLPAAKGDPGTGVRGPVGADVVGRDVVAVPVCHVGEFARWIHGH
jgi:hypothetical protein